MLVRQSETPITWLTITSLCTTEWDSRNALTSRSDSAVISTFREFSHLGRDAIIELFHKNNIPSYHDYMLAFPLCGLSMRRRSIGQSNKLSKLGMCAPF